MEQTNVYKFEPRYIETIDGRTVEASSEEWRLCCEAVNYLAIPERCRQSKLADVAKRRGEDGAQYLEQEMERIEHAYILALADKESRKAYLDDVERYRGRFVREDLEKRIVALWEQRKAAKAANGGV